MAKTKTASDTKKVLIADENEFIARTMHDVLLRNGFEAKVTNEGKKAVALARSFRPHLVVLDLQLTDMPGLDVLNVLLRKKKDAGGESTPRPKVIVYSALLDPEMSKLCKEAGADCLLLRSAATFTDVVAHVYRLMWPSSRGLVGEIRKQHAALAAVSQTLAQAASVPIPVSRLEEILCNTVVHAERMYCLEDALLRKESIEDGKGLAVAHNKLRDVVDGFQVRLSAGEDVAADCATYLSTWVQEHFAECARIAKEHFPDKKW